MKNEELKNVQNQEEEILNPAESETIEGGAVGVGNLEISDPNAPEKGEGCNCRCHG